MVIPQQWLSEAANRIAAHIVHTPLHYDPDNDLYLKLENHQVTGSFKARGALNKVLSLQTWELKRGLVTASAGNHGQGVALAGRQVGAPVIIFASEHAVKTKVEAMVALGADVRLVKGGYGEAEKAGLTFATQHKATWISPYNDGQVIAGQGTLALEVLEQLPPQHEFTWVVPVGGGGLISGIGAALTVYSGSRRRLLGAQSEASPYFHAILENGSQTGVVESESLADGLAGPVEENSITIPLLRSYVESICLVSELEIAQAIRYAWQHYQERIEGSAAAALAAVLSGKICTRPAIVIISGGNILPDLHAEILRNAGKDANKGF